MTISREDVFSNIAKASLFGNLGLFVGTGLSKALTNGEAPSFKELLNKVSENFKLAFNLDSSTNLIGKSFPIIAQEMVDQLAIDITRKEPRREEPFEFAKRKFKKSICNECKLVSEKATAQQYRDILKNIPIHWVITTNYDFLLEDILPKSVSLLPQQLLNIRDDFVPIYHLHGHIRSPHDLIITESDYIKLFSPTEYRQLKLNLLLAESTTIMLGYSLGDINVKTAIEWSNTFKNGNTLIFDDYQSTVIQVSYVKKKPNVEPYQGANGEIIVETSDLAEFLNEVENQVIAHRERHNRIKKSVEKIFIDEDSAVEIASNEVKRRKFLSIVRKYTKFYDVQMLIKFLDDVLNPIWMKATKDKSGFPYYDNFLIILLDIIENIPVKETHQSLLVYVIERLNDVAKFIDPNGRKPSGTSHSASNTWQKRKSTIPREMIRELKILANRYYSSSLIRLLE